MKYRRKIPKPIEFEAERWFGGEHPVVKPLLNHPDLQSETHVCVTCKLRYKEHGYIEQYDEHGMLDGITLVCPGDWIIPNPVPGLEDRHITRSQKEFDKEFELVPTS